MCFSSLVSYARHGDPLERIRRREPSFSQIAHVAYQNERLDWSSLLSLRRKLKKSPWLPRLYIGYDHALKDATSISITDNVSVTSAGINVGPDKNDLDEATSLGKTLHFRASWNLDELIYHPADLQILHSVREVGKARLQLNHYLFKIYQERRKLLLKYYTVSSRAMRMQLRETILDLSDQMNLFTDNQFEHLWWKGTE